MASKLQFFIGKGGVGKSTTAALTALLTSVAHRETRLVSLDPAHNQSDIFQRQFTEKPRSICPRLRVMEVDTEYWVKQYLQETQTQIKKTYRYQSAFNLQDCFNILQFAPGLEEYAMLLAFEHIIQTSQDTEEIIFDMAPTALTLRFFSLPSISLLWLEELLKLRSRIYDKKEIISRIKLGPKNLEQDKVKTKLETMITDFEKLRALFQSPQTRVNLVLNPDTLSIAEARRIRTKLEHLGLKITRVIFNKVPPDGNAQKTRQVFKDLPWVRFPYSANNLKGLDELNRYIQIHPQISEILTS